MAAGLADDAAADAVIADLTGRLAFDGVVNNVGLVRPQRLGTVEIPALEKVSRVNIHPAVQTPQAILPGMRKRDWGRMVNITSLIVFGSVERTA